MTETKNPDGSTTVSFDLDELSLDQLVLISQRLGNEIEKLREQRAHLKAKIDARLAAGERDQPPAGDAVAPGAVFELDAKA